MVTWPALALGFSTGFKHNSLKILSITLDFINPKTQNPIKMQPLHPKSLVCLSKLDLLTFSRIPRSPFFRISQFSSTPSPQFHSHSHYPSRRYEEESRLLRVSVWWDIENCTLPAGTNVFRVAQNLTAAVRRNGIKGPVQITAFGDVMQLSRSNQEALSSTGINLTHVPRGLVFWSLSAFVQLLFLCMWLWIMFVFENFIGEL